MLYFYNVSEICIHFWLIPTKIHSWYCTFISVYESHTINEANISKGSNLVLEPGPAPSTNQITLTFTPGDPSGNLSDIEVTLDKMNTVDQCLQCMILKAGFSGEYIYRLCFKVHFVTCFIPSNRKSSELPSYLC